MHKNVKYALAKTHREKIWIFYWDRLRKIIKRERKITPRRKTRKHLATTEEDFFVNILTTKLPARAARGLFRNKT